MSWILSAEQKTEAARRYADGESPAVIAADFGIDPSSVTSIARVRGVGRNRSQAQRRIAYNPAAFAADTPEARYWAGFLMADGTVVHRPNRSPTVALVLSSRDAGHLGKFRDFLGSGHAITPIRPSQGGGYISRPTFRFAVSCSRLAADLERMGVSPNKTHSAAAVDALAGDRDFWRGVFDGDGSVGVYKAGLTVRLVGSRRIVEQFLAFARTHTNTAATVRKHKSIFICTLMTRHAAAVLAALYAGATVALDRKQNAALEILRRSTSWLPVEGSRWRPAEARTSGASA